MQNEASSLGLDHAPGNGKADARANTLRFGGEERIENAIAYLLRNARAVVADGQGDVGFGRIVPNGHGDPPWVRDFLKRLLSVDEEIDQDSPSAQMRGRPGCTSFASSIPPVLRP